MSSLPRFFALVGLASVTTVVTGAPARVQLFGTRSGAVGVATVDAAALGDSLRSSLGLFAGGTLVVAAGVGAFGGALRGYIGSEPNRLRTPYVVGMGYARTLATRDLVGPLRAAMGAELLGGFRHEPYAPRDAGALSLTAPIGLSLGNPSGTSLGLDAAPYVEAALMRAFDLVGPVRHIALID